MMITKAGPLSYMISEELGSSIEVCYFLAESIREAQSLWPTENIVVFGDRDPKHSDKIRSKILGQEICFLYN